MKSSFMHMRGAACALFVILGAARILAQVTSGPATQAGTIMGTVVDTNGGVVQGAMIALQGPTPNDQRRVTSQGNGFFEFEGVKAGIPYTVSINAKGFAQWRSRIILRPGQTAVVSGIRLRVATVQVTTNVAPPEVVAVQQERSLESQRILSVIPNFYVSYASNPVPLSPKLKFRLALKMLTDPVTIAGFALNAGIYQASDYPGYQQGLAGYGQRLGATFAGGWTNVMVGDAILPSVLHQDPRYFFQGTGTKKSRLMHALSSPFVARSDDGHNQFNYSNIGGNIASGAISNAYYPAQDRGVHLVVKGALIGAGGEMINAVAQEFLLHKITSKHKP